jgi:LysR family transcriptional regulator, transcriptional activator of the cysJI operon
VGLHRKLGYGVELTAQGKEFLKGAESVLHEYHQLKETVSNRLARTERQNLKVGSSFAPSIFILPSLFDELTRLHPEVTVINKTGISEELEQLVLGGEIDLAFITKPGNLGALVYEGCGSGEVVAFISANHPMAQKKRVTLSELANVPLIVRTQRAKKSTRTWERLQTLANEKVSLSVAMDCDSRRTLRNAVKSGRGLGFCCRDYLAEEIKRGQVKALKVEGFQNSYTSYVIYAKDRPLSATAEELLALLRCRNGKGRRAARTIQQSI